MGQWDQVLIDTLSPQGSWIASEPPSNRGPVPHDQRGLYIEKSIGAAGAHPSLDVTTAGNEESVRLGHFKYG